MRCVGATTLNEYKKYIEKDAALERRFQQIYVGEPTVEDTIAILRGLKERYEVHHGVRIKDSAIVAAATLSHRYITDRFLPDKAIDLIDEAASRLRIEIDSLAAGNRSTRTRNPSAGDRAPGFATRGRRKVESAAAGDRTTNCRPARKVFGHEGEMAVGKRSHRADAHRQGRAGTAEAAARSGPQRRRSGRGPLKSNTGRFPNWNGSWPKSRRSLRISKKTA